MTLVLIVSTVYLITLKIEKINPSFYAVYTLTDELLT